VTNPTAEHLAIMFTDIVGSTDMANAEAYRTARHAHNTLIADSVREAEGKIIKETGDGFLLTFEQLDNAIQCAIVANTKLRAFPWHPETPIQVRFGIHYAQTFACESLPDGRPDIEGFGVHLASRVTAKASAGQVFVSEDVKEALSQQNGLEFTWHDLGTHYLKGAGVHHLWQIIHPDLAAPARPHLDVTHISRNWKFDHNLHFVGRSAEMDQLHSRLESPDTRRVAVVGMSGIGKTQIAIEYAKTHLADYPGGVFWIDARDGEQMKAELETVGQEFFHLRSASGSADILPQLYRLLNASSQPTLFILDNITDKSHLPAAPDAPCVYTLVTTQLKDLPENFGVPVEPEPLDSQASLKLLYKNRRAQGSEEEQAACDIVEQVQGLPLALALIADHINAIGCSFADYRAKLRENTFDTLSKAQKRFLSGTGHPGSLYDTLTLAYDALSSRTSPNRKAIIVLTAACCLSPRNIPRDLLFVVSGLASLMDFDEAVADLWARSFLTHDPLGQNSENTHELIRKFVHIRVSPATMRSTLTRVVSVLTERLTNALESGERRNIRAELPHYRAVLELARRRLKPLEGLSALLREKARFHYEEREYVLARKDAEEALRIEQEVSSQSNGANLAALIATLSLLSINCQDAGNMNADAAEKCVEAANEAEARGEMEAAMQHKQAETDHKRAETEYKQAAWVYGMRARRLARESLTDIALRADCFVEIGLMLRRRGRLTRALYLYDRAKKCYEQVVSRNDPRIAVCWNNMGVIHELWQDLDSAQSHFERALKIEQRAGRVGDRCAAYHNNIGRVLGKLAKQQDNQEGTHSLCRQQQEHHEQARRIYQELMGEMHPDVAACYRYLAETHVMLGDNERAGDCYQLALTIYERTCGLDYPACKDIRQRFAELN
jgi:class 3 adenylate cyclase/tetratricopeptide (TPR) repeat protein